MYFISKLKNIFKDYSTGLQIFIKSTLSNLVANGWRVLKNRLLFKSSRSLTFYYCVRIQIDHDRLCGAGAVYYYHNERDNETSDRTWEMRRPPGTKGYNRVRRSVWRADSAYKRTRHKSLEHLADYLGSGSHLGAILDHRRRTQRARAVMYAGWAYCESVIHIFWIQIC